MQVRATAHLCPAQHPDPHYLPELGAIGKSFLIPHQSYAAVGMLSRQCKDGLPQILPPSPRKPGPGSGQNVHFLWGLLLASARTLKGSQAACKSNGSAGYSLVLPPR